MVASGTLSLMAVDAKLWRKSWMRRSGIEQVRRNAVHHGETQTGAVPAGLGNTIGHLSRRGKPARISCA